MGNTGLKFALVLKFCFAHILSHLINTFLWLSILDGFSFLFLSIHNSGKRDWILFLCIHYILYLLCISPLLPWNSSTLLLSPLFLWFKSSFHTSNYHLGDNDYKSSLQPYILGYFQQFWEHGKVYFWATKFIMSHTSLYFSLDIFSNTQFLPHWVAPSPTVNACV